MSFFDNYNQYLQMSFEELNALPDDQLFEAVMIRTEHKVDSNGGWKNGIDTLNPCQKVFYSLNWLNVEVDNGGLCQFFANSSRMVAPLVSEYMAIIGADDHKKLYDEFAEVNKIDLDDLSAFNFNNAQEFTKLYDLYPFDDYDNAFYELTSLEIYLTKYARENLMSF